MQTLPIKAEAVKPVHGLDAAEAARRLLADGPNELSASTNRSLWVIAWGVVREPMLIMLVVAAGLYGAMGEVGDAVLLSASVLFVMGITIVQERRTERALESLRELSAPHATVIRDGLHRVVDAKDLVVGDFVVLAEGDRVPADGLLRASTSLSADESLLTGESVPVRKQIAQADAVMVRAGGDDLPCLYSGTLVTQGQGVFEVLATGARTELGPIGEALKSPGETHSPLQRETGRLVRGWALAGVAACMAVAVIYALTRGGSGVVWKQGLLAGITMAMAILPEEFPVILTVFFALGAWRLSRSHVLTRRMPAIEMLGAASVLCVDKTGTLTQNKMRLRTLRSAGGAVELHDAPQTLTASKAHLLNCAVLASKTMPFDPMERALHDAEQQHLPTHAAQRADWVLEREYPLTPTQLSMSHCWRKTSGEILVATKGAPEAVAALCRLDATQTAAVLEDVAVLAKQGLRVLAVAEATLIDGSFPELQSALPLTWVGLVAFEDPLRPGVPEAVAECQGAGVRVVMITGDYALTAQSIAEQAGIAQYEKMMTGPELALLDDETLAARVREIRVFARVAPDQKLRIVNALKAGRDIVAMTGDGVNDAPALKAAHIGIAMGKRGTDVARASAALVLEDDEFASIVHAIRLGRRIYDNIKKAVMFTLAVHVPVALLSIFPVFSKIWPLLLLPVHIVFLELVIDPACSLIFESEDAEATIMQAPPRPVDERLFTSRMVGIALLQGLSVFAAALGSLLVSWDVGAHDAARARMFVALVAGIVGIILVNRSWTKSALRMLGAPNPALLWVLGGTAVVLTASLAWPAARSLLHFAPISVGHALVSAALGLSSVLWFDGYKWWRSYQPARNP